MERGREETRACPPIRLGVMSEDATAGQARHQTPPTTGNAAVDAVLARAVAADDAPLADRAEQLRVAQEALSAILDDAGSRS